MSRPPYPGNSKYVRPTRNKDIPALSTGAAYLEEQLKYTGILFDFELDLGGRATRMFNLSPTYKQLRRVFLEFPAGKIEAGEDVLITGRRELLEETGYTASDWRHLGVLHPCIGYSDERIEIFSARGLQRTPEGQRLDEGEFVELLTLSLDAALEAVRHGEITDGKTIAALFWAEKIMRSGW